MKKRFSLRYKLILIFGALILMAGTIEALLAIRTARRAVIEKVETHLTDKARDIAEIIDGNILSFFQFSFLLFYFLFFLLPGLMNLFCK